MVRLQASQDASPLLVSGGTRPTCRWGPPPARRGASGRAAGGAAAGGAPEPGAESVGGDDRGE
eukprot:8999398-Pyramimonas_sp.AAC.1